MARAGGRFNEGRQCYGAQSRPMTSTCAARAPGEREREAGDRYAMHVCSTYGRGASAELTIGG